MVSTIDLKTIKINSLIKLFDINSDLQIKSSLFERAKKSLKLKTWELEKVDPSWSFVKEQINRAKRKACFINSDGESVPCFCILELLTVPYDYIQISYCHYSLDLCWRVETIEHFAGGSYTHCFARLTSDIQSDCLPKIENVIDAFQCFYYRLPWPEYITWEIYNI
jgi:hypothetical protein